MSRIEDLVTKIRSIEKFSIQSGMKIEVPSFTDGPIYCKIKFHTDRQRFLRDRKEIETLIEEAGLTYSIEIGWSWEHVNFENYSFNNPTPDYEIFVSTDSKRKSCNFDLSDTKDPLYDLSLFEIKRLYNTEHNSKIEFSNYKRANYGFIIDFHTQVSATLFDSANMFNREYSWEKIKQEDSSTVYRRHIYMDDKNLLGFRNTLASVLAPKKKTKTRIIKQMTLLCDEEIFAKIQSGEMSLEEFKQNKQL